MNKLTLALFALLPCFSIAQNIEGIINEYSSVRGLGNCANSLVVDNPEYFLIDEDAILIQMQGAIINQNDDVNFGTITNYNGAGSFEKAIITGKSGDTIYFKNNFDHTYDFTGKVQLITFPNYTNATITNTVTALPWNGNTGGVCAFQVLETLTMDAPIDVSGLGFRGGSKLENPGNCSWFTTSPAYFYPLSSFEGSNKGEGIAEIITGKELGKGAQGNGGGSGNDHNSGGGGGSNFGQGGLGGQNNDPGTFNCQGENPGIGGHSLDYSTTKAFLGGGGGAGHGNNGLSSAGSNGGGIVLLSGGYLEGSNKTILANGIDGNNSTGSDGAGGGGAGGCILLNIITYGNNLTLETKGGKGGDSYNESTNRCFGPAGGGAGGLIYGAYNLSAVSTSATGGVAGTVTGSTASCNGSTNGAMPGENGSAYHGFSIPFGKNSPECLITGKNEISIKGFKVYPNPTHSSFTIENTKGFEQIIQIIDSRGRFISEYTVSSKITIGEQLPNGVYFIRLKNHQSSDHIKLVKTK